MTVRFKSFITESVGAKGLVYEKKVFDAMKSAGVTGLDVGSKPGAGYSNQGAGDTTRNFSRSGTATATREV